MATITAVETIPFRLPLRGTLSWGKGGGLSAIEHMLIRVETDSGQVGVAEAQPRPTVYGETLHSIRAIVKYVLAPKLIGLDLDDKATIESTLKRVVNNHTARAALDIAICQARARDKGRRLFDTYKGPKEQVQVSFILSLTDVGETLRDAREVFEQGVRVFKVRVGRDLAHDEAVLSALKTEFGDAVTLYGDANESLDPKTAASSFEQYAKLGLAAIEAPLPIEWFKARAELKAERILEIIADESCFTLRDLTRELELDTFDVLNVKPARTGYTDSIKMLRQVREADRGAMIGSQASSGLGTLYSAILASRESVTYPCELSFPLKLEQDLMNKPFSFNDGMLEVAQLEDMMLDETKLRAASFELPPL